MAERIILTLILAVALLYILIRLHRSLRARVCSDCIDQCRSELCGEQCQAGCGREDLERMTAGQKSRKIGLRSLKQGQQGVILEVHAMGELGRRIRDMGLLPGAKVVMIGRAPLHDPVALRVSGITVALRNKEADFIKVEVDT